MAIPAPSIQRIGEAVDVLQRMSVESLEIRVAWLEEQLACHRALLYVARLYKTRPPDMNLDTLPPVVLKLPAPAPEPEPSPRPVRPRRKNRTKDQLLAAAQAKHDMHNRNHQLIMSQLSQGPQRMSDLARAIKLSMPTVRFELVNNTQLYAKDSLTACWRLVPSGNGQPQPAEVGDSHGGNHAPT